MTLTQEKILLLIKGVFALAALVALAWWVVRPVFKVLRTHHEPSIPSFNPAQMEEQELEIPSAVGEGKPDRQKIIAMMREDPTRSAQYISQMLRQK